MSFRSVVQKTPPNVRRFMETEMHVPGVQETTRFSRPLRGDPAHERGPTRAFRFYFRVNRYHTCFQAHHARVSHRGVPSPYPLFRTPLRRVSVVKIKINVPRIRLGNQAHEEEHDRSERGAALHPASHRALAS